MTDYDFMQNDVCSVAMQLLGRELEVNGMRVRIVETEAYAELDPASHAVTRAPSAYALMSTWGRIYVYQIYGVHHCLNITADQTQAAAVLIRAAEPQEGIDAMIARRGRRDHLLDGPGKLCQALGIDRRFNDQPLSEQIELLPGDSAPLEQIFCSPRVGIGQGKDRWWRYYLTGSDHVSRARENRQGRRVTGSPGSEIFSKPVKQTRG